MEEQTKQEWLMPSDIKEYETRKPEEMLNKYLARPVVKKCTEEFKDAETGEVVSVERSELLFRRGTKINQDVLAKLRFSMDAENIESVWVIERPQIVQRIPFNSAHIVTVGNTFTSAKIYVNGCVTPEDAAQLVCDFHSFYPIEIIGSETFIISESKSTSVRYVFDEDITTNDSDRSELLAVEAGEVQLMRKGIEDEIPLPESIEETRCWSLKMNRWFCITGLQKWKKDSITFNLRAKTALCAIVSLRKYLQKFTGENVIWDFNSIGKGNVDFVIPKEYVNTWEKKHYEQ